MVRKLICWLLMLVSILPRHSIAAGNADHVVLIVWDGMRPDFIQQDLTPTLYALARSGVLYENHHSIYCTATEVNGTALATGVYPERSGIIANRMYLPHINPLRAVDVQDSAVVRKGDGLSDGHYLLCPTLAEILQSAGKRTAIAGTKQVAMLHDRRDRTADSTPGTSLFEGKTLPPTALESITNLLGSFPSGAVARSTSANEARDRWTTRALLESLWSNGVPTFSLLWLSEPDFSQHAAGPGSPKALAALKSSDSCLAEVLAELEKRGVRSKTDVFVVSDHGFSTVQSSIDLAKTLQAAGFNARREFQSPLTSGDILVAGQGGSALLYVGNHDNVVVQKLVNFLQSQDFSGPLFTREKMDGTFTLDAAKLYVPGAPDVVMSMRWSNRTNGYNAPGMLIPDGSLAPGGGTHASLSRFDLHNTLVGAGPDLKRGYTDRMPTGNADLAPTILWLLGVEPPTPLDGRVLGESLAVSAPKLPKPNTQVLKAERRSSNGIWRQYLTITSVGGTVYLDEGNAQRTPER